MHDIYQKFQCKCLQQYSYNLHFGLAYSDTGTSHLKKTKKAYKNKKNTNKKPFIGGVGGCCFLHSFFSGLVVVLQDLDIVSTKTLLHKKSNSSRNLSYSQHGRGFSRRDRKHTQYYLNEQLTHLFVVGKKLPL